MFEDSQAGVAVFVGYTANHFMSRYRQKPFADIRI